MANNEYENNSAGQMYAVQVVKLWLECVDLSQQARVLWLKQEFDHDINYEYVARLTRLWGLLWPKVKGREDFKELVETFEKFQIYYRDSSLIVQTPEDIIRLEEVIGEALERLKLTKFD
jgi:hypothetical protein